MKRLITKLAAASVLAAVPVVALADKDYRYGPREYERYERHDRGNHYGWYKGHGQSHKTVRVVERHYYPAPRVVEREVVYVPAPRVEREVVYVPAPPPPPVLTWPVNHVDVGFRIFF